MAEFDRNRIRSIVKGQFGRDLPEFNIEEGLPYYLLTDYDPEGYLLFESNDSLIEYQLTDRRNHDFAKRTRLHQKGEKRPEFIKSVQAEFKKRELFTEYFVEFDNKVRDIRPRYGSIIVRQELNKREKIPLVDIGLHKNSLQNIQFVLGEISDVRQHEINCVRVLEIDNEIEDRTKNSAYVAFPGVRFNLGRLPYFTVNDARLYKRNDVIFSGSIDKSRNVNPNEIYPYYFKFYLDKNLLFLERYNLRKSNPAWVSFFPLDLDEMHLSLMSNDWTNTTSYYPVRFKKPN